MQGPVAGTINDWIQEHQTGLRLAFKGVRDRLKEAIQRRKDHDHSIRSEELVAGQAVLLKGFG